MIIQAWAPEMGSRDSPVGLRGGRRPPRRPEMLKTLQFPLFLRSARLLPPLSEICHEVPTAGDSVGFSLGNFNGWRNIVLQTAAKATLGAPDGPESSYGSSYLLFTPAYLSAPALNLQKQIRVTIN